jgi:hydroxymethylglutaryl-CoA lyase
MSNHVEIVEVGPRDGLQSSPEALPTQAKVEFIRRALAAGLRRIEVASFVNPKRVPQMADAEEVLRELGRPASGVHYVGLVLNRKGYERAVAAGCNEIGMAVVASDTFNRRNQGVSTDESVADWLAIAREAEAAGIRAQVTISAAFGCPFEGEVRPERVVELAKRVADARPFEIALADTVGVGVPTQVTELVSLVREAVPGIALRCHFHNTRNTGYANAQAAVQAGVRTLDASLGGLGGCPFAPAATGNIATEDLLYLLHRTGHDTGVSLEAAIATSLWLQQALGRELPGMLMKAGGFPRAVGAVA